MDNNLLDDEESHEDLLVFGYSCKIFRDDLRAKTIDDKQHLIPWMGDPENLIDRYDCRGALTDISRYEPGSGFIHDPNGEEEEEDAPETMVTDKEVDDERYRDLNEDEDFDERAYDRELNYRRFQSDMDGVFSSSGQGQGGGTDTYAAFQYNYDEQNHEVCMGPEPKRLHVEDSPFVKPVGLYIPEEIKLPETMKIHAIIEKTAKFIASQGSQMEILLKTKQAANPLFEFLNHDGLLNPYYKFLVHSIKAGIYRPVELSHDHDDSLMSSQNSISEEDSDHTYLHPSLLGASGSTSQMSSTISYSAVGSSSNKHNAYSMLVSKIKGTDSPDPLTQQTPSSSSFPQQPLSSSSSGVNNSNTNTNTHSVGYTIPSYDHGGGVPVRPKKQLPSSQDQLVIEKMASYVIKNGANFEVVAKSKGDPRFSFLDPSHEFHWYYLNCKERFKAECTAVVASSDFVNYSGSNTTTSSNNSNRTVNSTATIVSVKKSAVAAELAELKKKNMALLAKKESLKATTTTAATSSSNLVEDVFSRAKLVSAKEKDKPVIRFATSLSISSSLAPTTQSSQELAPLQEIQKPNSVREDSSKKENIARPPPPAIEKVKRISFEDIRSNEKVRRINVEEKEEGEIDTEPEPDHRSDSDPFDEHNVKDACSSPASEDDDEKIRRRMERKRKAALFLQNLKMSKITPNTNTSLPGNANTDVVHVATVAPVQATQVPVPPSLGIGTTGTSLGDLLSRRMKMSEISDSTSDPPPPSAVYPPCYNSSCYDNGVLLKASRSRSRSSSSSSNSYSRSRSRSYNRSPTPRSRKKRKRRSRSRSYSSSGSISSDKSSHSGRSRSSHPKKKSKKKHRKKKKKQEKEKDKHEKHKSSRSSKKAKKR